VLFFFLLCTKAQYRYSGGIISFELFLCCIQLISRANNIVLQTELHSIEVCTALVGAMASTEQRNDGGGGGGGGANDVSRQRKRIGLPDCDMWSPAAVTEKIFKEKLDFSKNAKPKVETMIVTRTTNQAEETKKPALIINLHQVFQQRFTWSVTSRIGSLENLRHRPSGGDRKIFKERVNFSEKATPRLNTMENKDYEPKRNEIKTPAGLANSLTAIKDKPQQQEQQQPPTKRFGNRRDSSSGRRPREQPLRQRQRELRPAVPRRGKEQPPQRPSRVSSTTKEASKSSAQPRL
uniref:Microtubule-binding protein TANGLED n=1 Tax=Macrostomum lignano TaxID=282301 RepID=A0A1I8JRC6_9PLAT